MTGIVTEHQPRGSSTEGRVVAPDAARGLLAVGLGAVGQLSALGLLATSAWLITTSSLRPPILTLTVAIAAVRLFALLRGLGRYGERLASHDLALRILARLRVRAYRDLEPLVPGGLAGSSSGDVLSRVVADVDATQDLVIRVAVPLATGLVTAVVAVVLSALVLPLAGLVLGAGLVAFALIVPMVARSLGHRGAVSLGAARGRLGSSIVEVIEGAPDIIAFGASDTMHARIGREDNVLSTALRATARATGTASGLASLVGGLTTIAVLIAGVEVVSATRPSGDHLSAVAVAVLGFVSLASFDAISTLPDAFARLGAMVASARRVRELGTLAPPVTNPSVPLALPPAPSALVLLGASVSYGRGEPSVIEGVDLCLVPGHKVALVGESGAGKSTVALALLRFVELSAGVIRLGDIDAAGLGADDVRAQIAWAPQDPHIFATSVAANLRLARPNATDFELEGILGLLGLSGWLEGLPDGLHSALGERGVTVSGGERQRLGLARALLADRPILVLDEPTAHLDEVTETLVREEVLAMSTGRALLWITHRLVGLEDFDEVVVLDRGRVVERGRAAALAAANGPYASLCSASTGADALASQLE